MSRRIAQPLTLAAGVLLTAVACGAWWIESHRAPAVPTIAFIPQTAGALLWDVEHLGATVAAEELKCHLYWNAPTSETDVAGQISLIDKVARGKYQGLVVAPNHLLAILSPLRRAIAGGLPVVVVSASLDLPSGDKLTYVVNDDEKMGELAAAEIARLIHGKGSVALVGFTRHAPGVMPRVRGAEHLFADRFPDIHVVTRLSGAYNSSRAEELTKATVDAHPDLKAVLSFTAPSTRGVHAALKSRSLQQSVTLVGCEQDTDLVAYVGQGEIAAIVAEDTNRMGRQGVALISAYLEGKPLPAKSVVPPLLITRENVSSPLATLFTRVAR